MKIIILFLSLLFGFILSTNHSFADCSKEEILQFINAGYSKSDIDKLCNKAESDSTPYYCVKAQIKAYPIKPDSTKNKYCLCKAEMVFDSKLYNNNELIEDDDVILIDEVGYSGGTSDVGSGKWFDKFSWIDQGSTQKLVWEVNRIPNDCIVVDSECYKNPKQCPFIGISVKPRTNNSPPEGYKIATKFFWKILDHNKNLSDAQYDVTTTYSWKNCDLK